MINNNQRPNKKTISFIWLGASLALALLLLMLSWFSPSSAVNSTNNAASAVREKYAALYQAAWRQDQGVGSTLVTATLLVPPAVMALNQDTGRSSTEEQICQIVNDLTDQQVPIVVTVDNVSGMVADDTIKNSLSLAADIDLKFTISAWTPIVGSSRITNTNVQAVSQIGVAVFDADRMIDWNRLGALTLTASQLGDQPARIFNWAQPSLLLEMQ